MGGVTLEKIVIEMLYSHEYRLLANDNIYDDKKFFYPVYQKSVELIKEIHSYPKGSDKDTYDNFCTDNRISYPNNLIMYCANRGGGKSSAMLSFGNALKQINDSMEESKCSKAKFWGELSKCRFSVLDAIDPTSLCEKEVIMKIILSRLFLEVRNLFKKKEKESISCDQRSKGCEYELINKFRECYKFINVINGSDKKYDDEETDGSLDDLASLGDSSNLKERFHELIELYLKYKYQTDKIQNKYLVIQIDDADLNAKMSYDIIEDLRRYCIAPNVIILMAVNMSQMHQVIEKHFVDEFSTLLNIKDPSGDTSPFVSLANIKDMAVKYINKVMPAAHQIYLPEIDDYLQNNPSDLSLSYIKEHKCYEDSRLVDLLKYTDSEKEKEDMVTGYQERVLRLVYLKTGIAMVKPQSYTHNFMPQSMRELTHFLSFMCSLPNLNSELNYAELFALLNQDTAWRKPKQMNYSVFDAKGELEKRQNNLEAFERYFINNWCDTNLSKSDNVLMFELVGAVSSIKVNFASNACDNFVHSFEDSFVPELTKGSFSALMRKIDRISDEAKQGRNPLESYKRAYALHLYFTIFLHREMMMSIKEHSFKRFRNAVGCELWTPNYSRFANYPLSGRFAVNYAAYLKLKQNTLSNKLIIGFWDLGIEQLCFLRSADNSCIIDHDVWKISKVLTNLAKRKKCDADLIFDIGFRMARIITEESSYECNTMNQYAVMNDLLLLLLNWDVNHYVERTPYTSTKGLREGKPDPYVEWRHTFLCDIWSKIRLLHRYLPFNQSEKMDFTDDICLMFDNIFYANSQIQIDFAKTDLEELKDRSPALIPEDGDMTKKSEFILNLCTVIIPALEQISPNRLDIISLFSSSISRIVKSRNDMSKCFKELKALINTEQGTSLRPQSIKNADNSERFRSERISSYITKHSDDLMKAYTAWKNLIDDDALEAKIEREIKESFGETGKGSGEQK